MSRNYYLFKDCGTFSHFKMPSASSTEASSARGATYQDTTSEDNFRLNATNISSAHNAKSASGSSANASGMYESQPPSPRQMDIESPTPKLIRKRSGKRKASRSPVHCDEISTSSQRASLVKRQRSDVDFDSLSISDRGRYVTANALLRRVHFERMERTARARVAEHSREDAAGKGGDIDMDDL